jgi:hypothetical protein
MGEVPRNKIDCGVAAYFMDASAELARLNDKFDRLRGRVHRGELDNQALELVELRSVARKFVRALEMAEHCIDNPYNLVREPNDVVFLE